MLKAIIFDFDGIIADTESIHLEAFKEVLKNREIDLTDKDYYNKYLAFDDRTLFETIFNENGIEYSESLIKDLIEVKHEIVDQLFRSKVNLFPGTTDFIELMNDKYVLSIASGALKPEIEFILNKFELFSYFQNITSAEEVIKCKPDPETFIKSLQKINFEEDPVILPSECLVIEDSVSGVSAAKSADMQCIAITNSYDRETLKNADLVVDSFKEIDNNAIEEINRLSQTL